MQIKHRAGVSMLTHNMKSEKDQAEGISRRDIKCLHVCLMPWYLFLHVWGAEKKEITSSHCLQHQHVQVKLAQTYTCWHPYGNHHGFHMLLGSVSVGLRANTCLGVACICSTVCSLARELRGLESFSAQLTNTAELCTPQITMMTGDEVFFVHLLQRFCVWTEPLYFYPVLGTSPDIEQDKRLKKMMDVL